MNVNLIGNVFAVSSTISVDVIVIDGFSPSYVQVYTLDLIFPLPASSLIVLAGISTVHGPSPKGRKRTSYRSKSV